jgi:fatty-acyl-CoA synthase
VSSLDIEDLILRMAGVAEAAVIGVADDKWGERPVALVTLKSGDAAPTEDSIRRHVAQFAEQGVISRYGVPDRVFFVEAIPKTSVGKLDKKVIRAKLGEMVAAASQ